MLAVLLIAATPQSAPAPDAVPERFSILADPCATARRDGEDDVVVCARGTPVRLPLPDERGPPDRPLPSNPDRTGMGALAAAGSPCATRSEGCTVGIDLIGMGVAAVRAAGKLVDPDSCCEEAGEATSPGLLLRDIGRGVKRAVTGPKVKGERIPIPLDPEVPFSVPAAPAAPAAG